VVTWKNFLIEQVAVMNSSKPIENCPYKPRSAERGVGMVEVLVTLVILAVGLLGVASLQFVGSFNNKEALLRTQAVMVAQQMSERLRASTVPSQVTDGFVVHNNYFDNDLYNFNNLSCSTTQSDYDCFCEEVPAAITNCQSGECNASEIAVFDAYQMSCSAVRENPNATLEVACINDSDPADIDTCTAGSLHSITIKWPMKSWSKQYKKANQRCNSGSDAEYDCVALEIAL